MPRKSAASFEVVPLLNAGRRRLVPPANLPEPVRLAFVELVAALDPGHFAAADRILVVEYCTAAVMARQAAEALEREGAVLAGARVNPWAVIQEKSTRALVALSMRLRVSPQSRLHARTAARHTAHEGSRGIEALSFGALGDDDA
jgi:phage terminase small subunit